MKTSKNTYKLNIVVGASSAISKDFNTAKTYYFGRTNPYDHDNFVGIPSLESEENIESVLDLIDKVLVKEEFENSSYTFTRRFW